MIERSGVKICGVDKEIYLAVPRGYENKKFIVRLYSEGKLVKEYIKKPIKKKYGLTVRYYIRIWLPGCKRFWKVLGRKTSEVRFTVEAIPIE